ncbi:MAG TPA: PLP-dependent aminotransferase family protein [Rhodospirillaceae bacterium]|nr:PLP-dependent aminotransferase family protein [Rhodospirillaceae bacterium]
MHLPIELDRTLAEPLQNQLYQQLRGLILSQRLKANTRLIATRFLAEQLGISRTTVLLAYERLISEGYLETRPAIGTYVSVNLPDQAPAQAVQPPNGSELATPPQAELHPPLFCAPILSPQPTAKAAIDFSLLPDHSIFPLGLWQRITRQVLDNFGREVSQPPPPTGIAPLKSAIAEWLATHRGIVVEPRQVIIVSGRQQGYNVAARLFLRPSDAVVVESPGDEGAGWLFQSLGANLCPVPVDEHGILTDQLPPGPVRLAHVTPAHQSPLGGTLPAERREQLIAWARAAGAYIIEDDCHSDFRYRGMGPPSLKSLDPYGLVLFCGSFSHSLGAGLRLGYLVVPSELVPAAEAAKTLLDFGNPWLEQMVLAEFMACGEYDRHLRRVRKVYLERRDCLLAAFRLYFGEAHLGGSDAGTHVTWYLPPGQQSAAQIRNMARARGIGVYTLGDGFTTEGAAPPRRLLLLGYAALDEVQIRDGIAGLAALLKEPAFRAAG